MVKIIIRGCNGRMGREISRLVEQDENAVVVAGVDNNASGQKKDNNEYPVFTSFRECNVESDVIIDFSSPVDIEEMLLFAKERKNPIVLCTTGLSEEELALVSEYAKKIPILRSANMSLGINAVEKLLKEAVKMLADEFDIEIVERHHNQKVDAPSGTALLLADAMNEVLDNSYEYNYDRTAERKKREKKEIGISAVRGGSIIGEHEVIFAGLDEVIEIKHTAYSRTIFAKGAIAGAKYLVGVNPGMYSMKDVVNGK